MKIIMVGTSFVGGGFEKVKMVNTFLQSMGHQVEVIDLPGAMFADKGWYYYQRARARLAGHEKRHMKKRLISLKRESRKWVVTL